MGTSGQMIIIKGMNILTANLIPRASFGRDMK
jgi:hypothetical protein